MQHSFKLIYVFVILFVIIVIVSMGMYIMKTTGEFTDKANLKLGENSEFNAEWQAYNGKQLGSMVKIIIDNAQENGDKPETLLDIAYKAHATDEFTIINSTKKLNNIDDMQSAISDIDAKHFYTIDLVYSEKTKQVTGILIKYAEKEKFEFTPDES